jgi:uncharacterized lipoprotein YajG
MSTKNGKKMKKNVKKALFLVCVLVLFTSCSKNIKKCYMKPKVSVNIEKKSESNTKFVDFNKTEAQLRCSF